MKAAQYVRMSTDDQRYSTRFQSAGNHRYAAENGMEIIKTYSDEGKSGLTLKERPGLQQLLRDVETGSPGFSTILVYDVIRWGRFQDLDEGAYYEYLCRRSGVHVAYCAEQFVNDCSPVSNMHKSIRRMVAGELSRELSIKVFIGKSRLVRLGFHHGGQPGFGLRRLIVDQNGARKFVLNKGERKYITTDRVILVPGPFHEVGAVRSIYRWFLSGDSLFEITARLEKAGVRCASGQVVTHAMVRHVVGSEFYIGNNVFNVKSFKLHERIVKNPPEQWVRKDGAFEAIISKDDFLAAQVRLRESVPYTNEEIVDGLRRLIHEHGRVSLKLVKAADYLPCETTIRTRFGGMDQAYALAGIVRPALTSGKHRPT